MNAIQRKLIKISGKVGLALLCLIIVLLVLLNSPFLQTKFINYWLGQQSERIGIDASVQSANIDLFSRKVRITGLEVYDRHQNLLLDAGSLQTSIRSFSAYHLTLGVTNLSDIVFQLRRYQEDSVSNFQQIIDFFNTAPRDSTAPDFALNCASIFLKDGDLSYVDDWYSLGDTFRFMDYKHVFLTDVNLSAKNVDIIGDHVLANIENLSFKEQKGVEISKFATRLNLSSSGIIARETRIKTPLNDIDLDMRFTTQSWRDYNDFIAKVRIFAKFRKSDLNLKTLVPFAPTLEGMHNHFDFSGNVSGYVNDFQSKNFNVSYGRNTKFDGDVLISGLPDHKTAFFSFFINNLTTSSEDIRDFLLPKAGKIALHHELDKLGLTSVTGQIAGYPDDISASVNLTSDVGSVETNLIFFLDTATKTFNLSGDVYQSQLVLGDLLNEKTLGNDVNVNGSFNYRFSSKDAFNLSADLICKNVEYQNKFIDEVAIKGDWINQLISGSVAIDDNDGILEFSGELFLDKKNPYLNVSGFFSDVDLHRLKFWNDTNQPLLSSEFSAIIDNFDLDSLTGVVNFSNLEVEVKDSIYHLNNLEISQQILPQGISTKVHCDYFNADVWGNYRFSDVNAIWNDVQSRYLSALAQSIDEVESLIMPNHVQTHQNQDTTKKISHSTSLDLTLDISNTGGLLSYILPDVHLPDGANIELGYNGKNQQHLSLNISTKNASAFDISVSHLDLKGSTEDRVFMVNLNAENLHYGGNRYMKEVFITSNLKNNVISWELEWHGMPDQKAHLDGSFEGGIDVLSKDKLSVNIHDSKLFFVDQVWQFDSNNAITIDSMGIHFQNVRFFNQSNIEEYMSLNGDISRNPNSRLNLAFNRYQLGTWAPFIETIGLNFDGAISGEVNIFNLYKQSRFDTDLKIEDFAINDFDYGTAALQITSNEKTTESFVTFDIKDDAKTYLSAKGDFFPNRTDKNFNIRISTPELDLSFLKNYVESFSSSLIGKISGDLTLDGTFRKPNFYGDLFPRNIVLKIDYLNTFYALSCEKIAFSLDSIVFISAKLEDTLHKTQGTLLGGVYHNRFKDIRFDLNLQMDRFFVLNTNQLLNEDFFGTAFSTGVAHLKGTPEDVSVDVQGRMEKGTEVKVNYSSKVNVSGSNQFIHFVTPQKQVDTIINELPIDENSTNIAIKLNIEATPDALFFFDMNIPPTVGLISASGNGNLQLNYESRNNQFTMFGDYVLEDGYYDFSFEEKSLGQLISRRFYIERGGNLQWTGDPSNMIMDISAIYSTRASLFPVLSANYVEGVTNENIRRKASVQSVISMEGRLSQPDIKFEFRLPNVDDDTRTQFFSLINPEDENEVSRQTFYLLLFGSFTSTTNSSNTAASGSNTSSINATTMATEMLSNQLNGILQNVSNNFSVGFNYKPEDLLSTEQTQLSLSTQFLDDRLTLDGQVSSGGLSKDVVEGSEQQNVVGEFSAEYRITDRLSAKAFNRSNDRDVDLLRTQPGYSYGIGVVYKREFDSLRSLFSRKKKKQKKDN